MTRHIGFVSTRFAGTDGVSLEARKWADILEDDGYRCHWFAGELDRNLDHCCLVPEAHFQHELIQWIHNQVFGTTRRPSKVTELIHTCRARLKTDLIRFIDRFQLDLLIIENALAIPMNLPLGIALVELLSETGLPAIAHHHDFYWERKRFASNAVGEYLSMAFPPNLPNIYHVVINSAAQKALAHRCGIAATVIPNVLDFDHPPQVNPRRSIQLRKTLAIDPDTLMVLQPTRIIRRKGIEMSVELMKALAQPSSKLVISHAGGDEGMGYAQWIERYADSNGVNLEFASALIGNPWDDEHRRIAERFSLWDIYPLADLVTFPSLKEGFGNALLEAIYFKKPLLVNRYQTFIEDIEPLGFDLISVNGFLTPDTLEEVRFVLESDRRRHQMVTLNYEIARRFFSYSVLQQHLRNLMATIKTELDRQRFLGEDLGEDKKHPHPSSNAIRMAG